MLKNAHKKQVTLNINGIEKELTPIDLLSAELCIDTTTFKIYIQSNEAERLKKFFLEKSRQKI